MTVSSTTNRKTFTGDDVTVAFGTSPVVFFEEGDLDVYVVVDATGVATLQTITTHYTVSGGDGSTGTVTMLTAPATGETLVIVRTLDLTQEVDFVNNEVTDAEVAEDALDRLTMIVQQLDARVSRSFVLPDSDVSGASTELPTPEASTLLGWNDTGDALQNYAAGEIDADILVSPFMETVLDDASAAAARLTLLIDANAKLSGAKIINGKIVRSVAASAATFALKTLAGNDPSASDPVYVIVPTVTSNVQDGGYAVRAVTSALSVVLSSGSTLGHQSAVASAVYVYALDNAGTIELAVSSKFFGGASVQSSSAEGGAGGADLQTTLYSTTARSNVACVCLQRWKSTQATAGTWAATTGEVQLYPFPFKAPKVTKVTATGTFTKDWDTLWLELYAKGGGGSGGGSTSATTSGGGGGEGEEAFRKLDQASFDPSLTVTVAAAAAAIAINTDSNGNDGGVTSIGTLLTAGGGLGGVRASAGGGAGDGGDGGANGDYHLKGAIGMPGRDSGGTVNLRASGGGKGGGLGGGNSGKDGTGGGGGGSNVNAGASGAGGKGVAVVTEHYTEGA